MSKSILRKSAVVLVFVMLVALFSACANNDKDNENKLTDKTIKHTVSETVEETTEKVVKDTVLNIKTESYTVSEPEQGGFFGEIFSFDLDSSVDGYEFKVETSFETYESTKTYKGDQAKFYFGTQQGPEQIYVRTYSNVNDKREYSDWYLIFDAENVDYDSISEINFSQWKEKIKNYKEFDMYNL